MSGGTRYLKPRELADKFGWSLRHVERLVADGKSPPIMRVGRSIRFPEDLADAWARDHIVSAESKDAA